MPRDCLRGAGAVGFKTLRYSGPLDRKLDRPASGVSSSGIHSAIDCKIRAGDVRGVRTSDKCHHCGDLVNVPVAVERCGGLLRHRPIARGGIQIRVDRTWLDVVDCDAAAPHLSGQPLSKYLRGSLRGGVGYEPGSPWRGPPCGWHINQGESPPTSPRFDSSAANQHHPRNIQPELAAGANWPHRCRSP
jgi:hypothetical protein